MAAEPKPHTVRWWVFLVAVGLVGIGVTASDPEFSSRLSAWSTRFFQSPRASRAFGVVATNVLLSQFATILVLKATACLFGVTPPRPVWAQRTVGLVESVAYPVLFALSTDALTGVGGWIGLKMFGDWGRWQEKDAGRKLLFRFMLANASQVGCGAVAGYALRTWASL